MATLADILSDLASLMSEEAANYLFTGVKSDTVTTLGGPPTLTPNDRALLDVLRATPAVAEAKDYDKFFKGDPTASRAEFARLTAEAESIVPSRGQPPVGPLPPGQQYVFNNQRGQWTIMEGYKQIAVVDQSGKIIQQIREPEDPTDTGLVSTTRISAGTGDIEPGELSRPAPPKEGEEPAGEPAATGDGVGGVPTPPAVEVDMGVPEAWETAAMEMYPEYYALVKNVPEISDILKKYIAEEWSETKFLAELRKTNWYKTTTASAREWDLAAGLDPATYQTKINNQAATIEQKALDLGFRLSEDKINELALNSLRLGWTDQFLTNAMGMIIVEGGDPGATQLRQGYYGQQIRGIARDYGVSLDDNTLMSFANKMAVGEETVGSFQDYALTIAKSLYPTLSEQFDLGRTFSDLTSNYRDIAAKTLEIDANSIDFTDPQWAVAVTYQPDPKTGEQRMMNLSEWGDYIRKNRAFGYEYTDDAKQKAYKVANELANLFGKV